MILIDYNIEDKILDIVILLYIYLILLNYFKKAISF